MKHAALSTSSGTTNSRPLIAVPRSGSSFTILAHCLAYPRALRPSTSEYLRCMAGVTITDLESVAVYGTAGETTSPFVFWGFWCRNYMFDDIILPNWTQCKSCQTDVNGDGAMSFHEFLASYMGETASGMDMGMALPHGGPCTLSTILSPFILIPT